MAWLLTLRSLPIATLPAVPWVRVLDAYSIARTRADAHPGPDPKTNPKGRTDSPRLFDDCLHYCLPGMPDLFNGRLQRILEQTAADKAGPSPREASGDAPPAAGSKAEEAVGSLGGDGAALATAVEGAPGALVSRWNFAFDGAQFVQGASPHLAVKLQRGGPATPLECPQTSIGLPAPAAAAAASISGGGGGGSSSLLGFCSDLDPPSLLRRGRNHSTHALGRARRSSAGLAGKAAAVRRANKAELIGKASLRSDLTSTSGEMSDKKKGANREARAVTKAGVAVPSKDEWEAANEG